MASCKKHYDKCSNEIIMGKANYTPSTMWYMKCFEIKESSISITFSFFNTESRVFIKLDSCNSRLVWSWFISSVCLFKMFISETNVLFVLVRSAIVHLKIWTVWEKFN